MKDNFSGHAVAYAKYRPTYPEQLYAYLYSLLDEKKNAWDCATGNGQVAVELVKVFDEVWATDLSENQLKEAEKREHITYEVHTAEDTVPYKKHFDLITVAQAIHWFDFDRFYTNVNVALKDNGILAVIGYSLITTAGKLNEFLKHFYEEIIGKYWDAEREYLDNHYRTIPFPFREEVVPQFTMDVRWTQEQLLNYLNTWSAVKHYEKEKGENPLDLIKNDVKTHWGKQEKRLFEFPLFLRVGHKN
ncbi:class I SAM-dependent methyltransferase [Flavimarina sp. Hel_I_48]|uniref:class I SAM-dependent methyltransferase n=1 Tax=Flavimarina sp. Hel_I_48 TaxID=1392488 RepID=UPI0004DFC089|nr:class I SAM-dependent methyltransferase [Flavimarina sp. Hel_I_48]